MHSTLKAPAALALLISHTPAYAQEAFDLGEIVLSATAIPLEKKRLGSSVEILGDGVNVGQNADLLLQSSLQRLPGVSAQQNGPAGTAATVSVRGIQERYTAIYIDGMKVNDPSSTSGQYANFGGFLVGGVNRVEILKGSQSALHGSSAVAGVINVYTLPDLDGPEGTKQNAEVTFGSYGTASATYGFTQRTGDLSMALSLTHAQSDGFSAGDENNGNVEPDGFESTRLSFGLAYQASDSVRVDLTAFTSDNKSEFDEGAGSGFSFDGTPGDETGERRETGVRVFTEIDNGGAWQHELSMSLFNVDRSQASLTTAPSSFGGFTNSFEGERRRLDWQSNGRVNEQLSLSFGADVEKVISKSSSIPGGQADTENYGVFAEAVYSPSDMLDVIGTIRHEDNSQFGNKTTGKLALSYRPNEALTLRGVAATGFRAPVPSELYSAFPSSEYFGNPNLKPEESLSVEVGADYDVSEATRIGATIFKNEIDNLVQYAPCPYTDPANFDFSCQTGTFSTVENTPGTSSYRGVEFSLQHSFSDRASMSLAYTYLDAKTAAGARLPRVARHELFLGADIALSDRLSSQLGVTHVAGRPDSTSPAQAMPDYTVVDLSFEYDLSSDVSASLALHNLFDEQYQTVAGYGTSDRAIFFGVRASF